MQQRPSCAVILGRNLAVSHDFRLQSGDPGNPTLTIGEWSIYGNSVQLFNSFY